MNEAGERWLISINRGRGMTQVRPIIRARLPLSCRCNDRNGNEGTVTYDGGATCHLGSRKYKLIRRPFFKGGRARGWASIRPSIHPSNRTINPTPSGSLSGSTLPRENRTHAFFFPFPRILILCALVTAIYDLSIVV